MSKPRKLTDRRERFCDHYVSAPGREGRTRFNATASAEAAGFAGPGSAGWRLLQVPAVARRIDALFFARWIKPRGPESVAIYRDLQRGGFAGAATSGTGG